MEPRAYLRKCSADLHFSVSHISIRWGLFESKPDVRPSSTKIATEKKLIQMPERGIMTWISIDFLTNPMSNHNNHVSLSRLASSLLGIWAVYLPP